MKFVYAAVILIFLGIKCKNYGKSYNFLYLKGSGTPSLDAIHVTHLARRSPTSTVSPRRRCSSPTVAVYPSAPADWSCSGTLPSSTTASWSSTADRHTHLGWKWSTFSFEITLPSSIEPCCFCCFCPFLFPPSPLVFRVCRFSFFLKKKVYMMKYVVFEVWVEGGGIVIPIYLS